MNLALPAPPEPYYAGRTTVIFGTRKDESLLINSLASNNCFTAGTSSQNGVEALLNIVDALRQKDNVQILLTFGTNTY